MRTLVKRIIVPVALCAALALAVVGHAAADEEHVAQAWATVNVCDPAANQVGARVSVTGSGGDETIWSRISLQWYSEAQAAWLPVEGAPSSTWLEVGSARQTSQQAGYTFNLDQPADGRTKQIRALAEVQWRDGATVVRSTSAVTQAGLPTDVGGSQASCALS
ncbi:MAG: hypothetical protein JW895_14790 [Thermoleophilaceae bacterium]|nr:hypothetical protein [Thermoleophilaceae bacterium]